MKIHNSLVPAGGAGQISQATAINDKSWLVLTINIHVSSCDARCDARIPQVNAIHDNSQPLIKDASPYSAFDLSIDRQDGLMDSEKLAR